jgi:hypothetical protein
MTRDRETHIENNRRESRRIGVIYKKLIFHKPALRSSINWNVYGVGLKKKLKATTIKESTRTSIGLFCQSSASSSSASYKYKTLRIQIKVLITS